MSTTAPTTRRQLATIATIASIHEVTPRTVRNWISKGLLVAYRVPGTRGIRLDVNEVQRALRVIPSSRVRAGEGSFGPNAQIVDLPYQAEAVLEGEDQ